MSTSQFKILMDRFDSFEKRLRRVEISLATGAGMMMLLAFLIANNKLNF
jgi:hypothetical protein